MKYLLALLLILPNLCSAQVKWRFESYTRYQCINWLVESFVQHDDTVVCKMPEKVLKPTTKTIYIQNADYIKDMPATIGNYAVKLIDVDKDAKMLYKEQQENGAIILHMTDGLRKNTYYTFWVMQMIAVKKGKKYRLEYQPTIGFKADFFFNDATAKMYFDKTECL